MSQTFTYRTPSGNVYKIAYHSPYRGVRSYYVMTIVSRPSCTYPTGVYAHLLSGDQICVATGRDPTTLDRAKAIALHWIRGFEEYRTTGVFPNGPAKYNIVETRCPTATQAPPPAIPTPAPPIPAPARATFGGPLWDASLRGDLP